ncbi:endolytic transglycosylase MltG [Gordonia otitidis]|nr:endolytic transglycosylase MltG [Gordonia otitidis]UEA59199.1 endolytic transglycosylase MltG [Gordonia otitidis]
MTDERHRNRHREPSDHDTEGLDLERLRYFTQPAEGKPHNRHRRRRTGTTGQIPIVRGDDGQNGVNPTAYNRTDANRTDANRTDGVRDDAAGAGRTQGSSSARRAAQRPGPRSATTPPAAPPTRPQPAPRPHTQEPTTMRGRVEGAASTDSGDADAFHMATPRRARPQRISPAARPPASRSRSDSAPSVGAPSGGAHGDAADAHGGVGAKGPDTGPVDTVAASSPAPVARATATVTEEPHDVDREPNQYDAAYDSIDHDEPIVPTRRGRGRPRTAEAQRRRRKRRGVLAAVIVIMLVAVGGVGYYGLRAAGLLDSRKDYTNAAGTGDVIVDIPQNSTLKDFGRILADDNVVGSQRAFINAADGQAISGGFYKMRTEIPASTAVQMLTDGTTHRVGRVVVPEGLQIDTKKGVDGKTTPGIFQMISDATAVTVNGRTIGVTVDDLQKAAATTSAQQLGVPDWAVADVEKLNGDHRRIEGLIAPGTWETIDPHMSATQILHELISQSAQRFAQWGLGGQNANESGLTPYQTLVAASVVEREVAKPDDYAKVARVILNRLDKDQRLEMDSTANYTATVTNIDLDGEAYKSDNAWNTYQMKGLPATPIGAVGERALEATEHPESGNWLYFVTVDRNGTTLFADTFDEHKRNREQACENKLLTTGCS